MRESCTYGSVRGALSNERPYRDCQSTVPRPSELCERDGPHREGEEPKPMMHGTRV